MTVDFTAAKRERDENPNKVRCAHCGAWIEARATRCPKCGTHFLGVAMQFTHAADDLAVERSRRTHRARTVAIALAVAFAIAMALYFLS